jgi:hypothetical protein
MNYLIWSYEHTAWWLPNSKGYTKFLSQAGNYTPKQAGEICAQANVINICEIMVSWHMASRFGAPTHHPYQQPDPQPAAH